MYGMGDRFVLFGFLVSFVGTHILHFLVVFLFIYLSISCFLFLWFSLSLFVVILTYLALFIYHFICPPTFYLFVHLCISFYLSL